MSGKGDVKQSTVEKMTAELVKSSNGKLSESKARDMVRDSAERVNRERRGEKR